MPTTEPERQPALHLIDTDLAHVYEMPAELAELDQLLAKHAAFDLYIAERETT